MAGDNNSAKEGQTFQELDLNGGKIVGCDIIKHHSEQIDQIMYGLKFKLAWLCDERGVDKEPVF